MANGVWSWPTVVTMLKMGFLKIIFSLNQNIWSEKTTKLGDKTLNLKSIKPKRAFTALKNVMIQYLNERQAGKIILTKRFLFDKFVREQEWKSPKGKRVWIRDSNFERKRKRS